MKTLRKIFITCLIVLPVTFSSSLIFAATPNTCVTCHTNDSLMKSLHKPPPLPAGEGEG